LARKGETLVLAIEDNGSGMLPGYPVEDHFGLVGMRERAAMIGAKLEVQSATDYGTAVVLEIPN
jgi:signal transduction histidine kinase